jgi:hypothetical protein
MAARAHRPLKVTAFNASGIWRQHYQLSKQLQDLHIHIDVALLSETHLKPHERFFITNYHFYWTDRFPGRKGGTAVTVRKGIPHNHVRVYLPPFVSIEVTGVCISIGNSEVLLTAVCKLPGHAWNDVNITELLGFGHKSLLADLNPKLQFLHSIVSNPSGAKLLNLLHINEFKISAPQCSTHYCPAGSGDVLHIVVHKDVPLSEVTVS